MTRAVVNALNLASRGGRTVLIDCVQAMNTCMPAGWNAVVYARDISGLPELPRIEYRQVPSRLGAWLDRLWFEWHALGQMEANNPVALFFSLQGASARIRADRSAVYVHHNLPLAPWPLRQFLAFPKLGIQRIVYDLVYRFGIRKRDWVIVQQDASRKAFRSRYGMKNIIVAQPLNAGRPAPVWRRPDVGEGPLRIFAPLVALAHKDVETAIEGARLLKLRGLDFQLTLTIDPAESAYAMRLAHSAADVPEIRFCGFLGKDALDAAYKSHHLLLYTPTMESWGLPLSEGASHGIGILAIDAPYARETIGDYDGVTFFPPGDAHAIANSAEGYWTGTSTLGTNRATQQQPPYAENWDDLIRLLTSDTLTTRENW